MIDKEPQPSPTAVVLDERAALREIQSLVDMCKVHGDFRNGVTDPTGSIDEGNVRAGEIIDAADKAIRMLRATSPQPAEQTRAASPTTTAYREESDWIEAVMTLADDERLDSEADSEAKAECRAELRRLLNMRPERMPDYPHPRAQPVEQTRALTHAAIGTALISTGLYDRMNDITGGDREARHLIEELISVVDPILHRHHKAALTAARPASGETE